RPFQASSRDPVEGNSYDGNLPPRHSPPSKCFFSLSISFAECHRISQHTFWTPPNTKSSSDRYFFSTLCQHIESGSDKSGILGGMGSFGWLDMIRAVCVD